MEIEVNELATTAPEPPPTAGMTLACIVCKQDIPDGRARRRSETCSLECNNALRRFRREVLMTGKCPHCLHPATAEERERFRKWRISEGRKAQRGNPHTGAKEKRLAIAMGDALQVLKERREEFAQAHSQLNMDGNPDTATVDANYSKDLAKMDARIARLSSAISGLEGNPLVV
jgi:hypothetical protein